MTADSDDDDDDDESFARIDNTTLIALQVRRKTTFSLLTTFSPCSHLRERKSHSERYHIQFTNDILAMLSPEGEKVSLGKVPHPVY